MKLQFANFNIFRFIKLCFKSWPIFLVTVLSCAIFFGLISVIKKPKAEVMAQLMIKDDSGSSSMLMAGQIARSFSLGDMFGGSTSTDNEVLVLNSHTIFLETAQQLGLNVAYYRHIMPLVWRQMPEKSPIQLVAPENISDTLSKVLVFKLKHADDNKFNITVKASKRTLAKLEDQSLPATITTDYGTFTIEKTTYYTDDNSDYRVMLMSYDMAASTYSNLVNIYVPDRKADFIDISFVTDNPGFGKKLINTIINNYVDVANDYKLQRSRQSLKLVDDRLESLSTELLTSETDIEKFKLNNSLTDPEIDAQYLMSKTGNIEASLLEAQTNFEVVKMTRDFIIDSKNNYSLIPELLITSGVATASDNSAGLIAQYNKLILDRMQLMATAKSTNSAVVQLDQQIDALRENIITSINRVYENSKLALNDLKSENNKNKLRLNELPTIERQYIILKRDNMLQEQIYLFLLQQREELNMSLASRTMPAQVIDEPYVLPDDVGMSAKMLIAIGIFLGLVLGALYVLLLKLRKSPITSLSELNMQIAAPKLQALKYDNNANHLIVTHNGDNAEPLRKLRSEVIAALNSCAGKAMAVTSVNHGEGKSYVAVNLATSMAVIGNRSLLIDMSSDAKRQLADNGLSNANAVTTDCRYNSSYTITTVNISNVDLDILSAKDITSNRADIVASQDFAQLMSDLRADYDCILIDTAAIKDSCEIYSLTDNIDITLIVCSSGIVSIDDTNLINTLYADASLKRIAVIANAFK